MREPIEPEKYERDWQAMRNKSLGALLESKLRSDTSPYQGTLTEMELERRTYVRDRQFDRTVTLVALIVSIIALIVAVVRTNFDVKRVRAAAAPTASSSASPAERD